MKEPLPSIFFEEFASSAQKKRLKILESLLKIIIRDGLAQLSLAKLSTESKVPRPLILYHFPDLRDAQLYLFKMVARVGQEVTVRNVQRAQTAQGKLELMTWSAFEWALRYPDYARYFLLMHHYASVDARFQKVHEESTEVGTQRIAQCLDEMYKKKLPKSDLLLIARGMHACLSSAVIRMVTANDFKNVEDYLELVQFTYSKLTGREIEIPHEPVI